MKQQVFNPYLPSWEYIPDGEPYVFGDRVYVYGSHDSFGAPIFCVKDYVCWSAPVTDLSDWRYEGVIYRKNQDPSNKLGIVNFFVQKNFVFRSNFCKHWRSIRTGTNAGECLQYCCTGYHKL